MGIIKVENLCKRFKNNIILDKINFDVEKGTICSITGKNGSGKSVLLKCICGFMRPDSGEIHIGNYIIPDEREFPENAGIIIEDPRFYPSYTGFNNLLLLSIIQKKIDEKAIRNCMKLVGLNPDLKTRVGKYSVGMKQRLGIAQAIMEKPDILILDEPTNGLDDDGREDIIKIFLKLNKEGTTILFSTHYKESMVQICHQSIKLCISS